MLIAKSVWRWPMYIVVSRWEVFPGMKSEFDARSKAVRAEVLKMPAVERLDSFYDEDGTAVAIICYTDEASYKQTIQDPNGPFEKALAQHKLEEVSRWLWSARGEEIV